MPIRAKPLLACTALLAACALAFVVLPKPAAKAAPSAEQLAPEARTALAICREHAAMEQDVAWAAACIAHARSHATRHAECMRGGKSEAACDLLLGPADDSADCMLPNDRAARLNAMLAASEDRCMDQALADNGALRAESRGWLRRRTSAQ